MRIRKMRPSDVPSIVRLIHNVYGAQDATHFRKDMAVSTSLTKESPYRFEDFFVAEIENRIVAVGGAWALHFEPVARMDWFIVAQGEQKKGLGTLLLHYIEKKLRERKIRVLVAETSSAKPYRTAVRFYEKNGFMKVGEIKRYWDDGSAWLCFMKRL